MTMDFTVTIAIIIHAALLLLALAGIYHNMRQAVAILQLELQHHSARLSEIERRLEPLPVVEQRMELLYEWWKKWVDRLEIGHRGD